MLSFHSDTFQQQSKNNECHNNICTKYRCDASITYRNELESFCCRSVTYKAPYCRDVEAEPY